MAFGHRLVLALLGLSVLVSGCNRSAEVGLHPGDAAPPIELADLGGTVLRLSDYRGKAVLLNFWASWCQPCIQEMPSLERLQQQLGPQGLAVVSVAVDDQVEALAQFRDRFKLSFPILLDVKGAAKKAYKIKGYPETFLLDREGRLVMLPDPDSQMPVVRLVGPREWDQPQTVDSIRRLVLGSLDGD